MMILAGTLMAGATETTPASDYRLKTGDQVEVSLSRKGQVEQQFQAKLDSVGRLEIPVSTPYADTYVMLANGKSVKEITTELQAVLAKYRPATEASVAVAGGTAPSRGTVTFCGEVQGVVSLASESNSHVAQAVDFLGTSRFADLRKVQINRVDANGTTRVLTVDVEKILKDGYRNDVALQPGDIISVPQALLPHLKPATEATSLPVDKLRMFCQMSFGKPEISNGDARTPALAKASVKAGKSTLLAAR